MKRVLVTGASGFVGFHALAPLAERGFEIHAVSSRGGREAPVPVQWHRADLLEGDAAQGVLAAVRPSHLLHFAWYAEPGKYWRSAENFRWLEASIALLRRFHAAGGRRVVMAGTCAEYDWSGGTCVEDATPRKPSTPYGVCKNALQEVLRSYCQVQGVSGAWGRIFFLHGPDEHPSRLVPSVVNALLRGEPAACTHGNQVRDYLSVEEVGSAFAALLDSDVQGPVNIASGEPVTLRQVVLAAAAPLAAAERVRFGAIAAPADEPPVIVADVRRLREEVGWRPRTDLAAGLLKSVAHWRSAMEHRGHGG